MDDGRLICVMVRGIPLTEISRDALLVAAILMIGSSERHRRFRNDEVEGVLTTKFEDAVLGTFVGKKFFADIETEHGQSRVVFIVDESAAEAPRRVWSTFNPERARNAQFN